MRSLRTADRILAAEGKLTAETEDETFLEVDTFSSYVTDEGQMRVAGYIRIKSRGGHFSKTWPDTLIVDNLYIQIITKGYYS
jgi:hypothetical protein